MADEKPTQHRLMSQISTIQVQINVLSTLVRSVCLRLILIWFMYSSRAHLTRPQATAKLPWMMLVKLTTDSDDVRSIYYDFSLHFISPVAATAAAAVAHLESQCAHLGACFHSQSSYDAHCYMYVHVYAHVHVHSLQFTIIPQRKYVRSIKVALYM